MDTLPNIQPVRVEGSAQVEGSVQVSDIVAPVGLATGCGRTVETVHRGLSVSDYVHRMTHDGQVWRLAYRWDALDAGATAGMLLQTPQEREFDLTWDAEATGLCTIDLFEQPTVTALGIPLWQNGVFRNKNRQIGMGPESAHEYPPGMGAYIDPTIAGWGRYLVQQIMGGAAWKATTPGESAGIPWILLEGMSYYLRITNTTEAAIYVAVRLLCTVCGTGQR